MYKTRIAGLMCGSSLDGMDLCDAEFFFEDGQYHYNILKTKVFDYPESLRASLQSSTNLDAKSLHELDAHFAKWVSSEIEEFIKGCDALSFHGHTVFHFPDEGISLQFGNPNVLSTMTNKKVVADFRSKDIQYGGQGAPLVPTGEKHLFNNSDAFLNLGGIANVTLKTENYWLAGDIAPFNQVLNYYAAKCGKAYDENGSLAASGNVIPEMVERWRSNSFFIRSFPKSLDNGFTKEILNQVGNEKPQDVLRSYVEFVANEIVEKLNTYEVKQLLVSGGGTWNEFFIKVLQEKSSCKIEIPDAEIVNFKEALIFGFLGYLRINDQPNVMSACTGAVKDTCSGVIYTPN